MSLAALVSLIVLLSGATWARPQATRAAQATTSTPQVTASPLTTNTPSATATSTPSPTPTASAAPTLVADAYEPNNTFEQAPLLTIGQRIDKLSFWPIDDLDVFAIDIKQNQIGQMIQLDTYQQFGLDTRLRLLHIDGRLIAENDDVDPQETRSHLQIKVPEAGRYIIEISNRSQARPDFKTYSLETSWVANQPTPTPTLTSTPTLTPTPGSGPTTVPPTATPPPWDRYEPNNTWLQAQEVAVGEELKSLNFVCPDQSGCADNDFFKVALKAGVCYRFATTDLAHGIDTNIIVFGPNGDREPPLGGNDDSEPGNFRSQLDVCVSPNENLSLGYVLVGNAGNRVPPEPTAERTYNLKITTFQPEPPKPTVTATLQPTPPATVPPMSTVSPTSVPVPSARPTAAPSPPNPSPSSGAPSPAPNSQVPAVSGVSGDASVPRITDAPKGIGVVIVTETDLHVGPGARTEVIVRIKEGEQVKLFGEAQGAWVRVQPYTAVVPGWIYAADLSPLPGTFTSGPVVVDPKTGSTTSQPTPPTTDGSAPGSAIGPDAKATVTALSPIVATPEATPASKIPLAVTVNIVASANVAHESTTSPTVSGVRVQLVNRFGDILVEAVMPASGQVTLNRDIAPSTALFVQIPSSGVRHQLNPEHVASGEVQVTIALPR